MTHVDLVTSAVRWLKRSLGCGVVLAETGGHRECPDAIGWRGHFSIMVECKVSRADFRADMKKRGRINGRRLAHRCYYLTEPGLVQPNEVPEDWGLLHARGGRVHIIKEIPTQILRLDDRGADALREEVYLLYCELRRYHAQGITYETLTGRTAQQHLLDNRELLNLAIEDDLHEARRLMGLEGARA